MTPAIKAAEKAKITFAVHKYDHHPDHPAYGEEAATALGLPPERVFKTLVVMTGTDTAAVAIVPVAAKLSLKACAAELGEKRARMALTAAAERMTGYVVGGISPLGQKKRLRTVLDDSAMGFETVYVSAGRRGLEIELTPGDLARLTGAVVAPIAAG